MIAIAKTEAVIGRGKTVDYVADCRLASDAGHQAFSVSPDHYMTWPFSHALLNGSSA